MKWTLNTIHY